MRRAAALLLLAACGSDGRIGLPGKDGGSCTVHQEGLGARIDCDDGSFTLLEPTDGPPGLPGEPAAPGRPGTDGPLLRIEDAPEACPGGAVVRSGRDADGNDVLDDPEVETSLEICPPVPTCTQAENDLFFENSYDLAVWQDAGCTSAARDMVVAVPGLPDLGALRHLESVGGNLLVYGTAARSLAGLESLRDVGALSLLQNDELREIRALSALRTAGEIEIAGSPALQSLDGLQGVTETTQLTLERTGVLDLAALAELAVSPVALTLRDNPNLQRVDLPWTLYDLDVVDIRRNDALVSLAGLRPARVDVLFDVRKNPLLPQQEPLDLLELLQRRPSTICLDGNEASELCP